MKVKNGIFLLGTFALLMLLLGVQLYVGSSKIPWGDVIDILLGKAHEKQAWVSIVERRFTRGITSIFACGGLAVAGLIMQTIFKNPLSGPSVLGISSGASLGVAIVILAFGGLIMSHPELSQVSIFLGSILGGIVTLLLVLFIGKKIKNNTVILIAGMMFSYLASAVVSILIQKSEATDIQQYALWGMGSFSHVNYNEMLILIGVVLVSLLLILLKTKFLNMSLMGDKYAESMGVSMYKQRMFLILVTGLLTGAIVSYCGPIAFVGIAIPHVTKMIFKTTDHLKLVPFVFVVGAVLGLICSIFSEVPYSLPVNALTSIIGAPVVLFILIRNRKNWIR